MKSLIRTYLINVFTFWVLSTYVGIMSFSDPWRSLLLLGLGFTFIHLFIKPILKLFTGPVNFITLGVVDLLTDAVILYLLTNYLPYARILPWSFSGFYSSGFNLPPMDFNVYTATVLCALFINIIRGALLVFVS